MSCIMFRVITISGSIPFSSSHKASMPFGKKSSSSASIRKIHSPHAASKLSFRWYEKSLRQGETITVAPYRLQISTVSSVDPVSTTTISSTRSTIDPRQRARLCASSLTIKQADRVGRFVKVSSRARFSDGFRSDSAGHIFCRIRGTQSPRCR